MRKDLYVHIPIERVVKSTTLDFAKVSIDDAKRELVGEPAKAQPDWSTRRKPSDPNERLSEATVAWMAGLPENLRPTRMAERFARIANKMCGLWANRLACSNYLTELLIVDRRHRQGFPADIAKEIGNLAVYFAATYPLERSWANTLNCSARRHWFTSGIAPLARRSDTTEAV